MLLPARQTSAGGSSAPPPTTLLLAGEAKLARVFESDDGDLNRFTARLQRALDPESPSARQAAIARLEAVIARLHRT